jgi:phytoene dehydrogenase-like protein
MYDADIAVIGAGLTGLRAALEFAKGGLSVLVLEEAESVGGRLKTTVVNGAVLDHGFQVLLTAYPEFSTIPSLDPLKLRWFESGARLRVDSRVYDIYDPLRHPLRAVRSLAAPVVTIRDLALLGLFLGIPMMRRNIKPRGESTADSLDRRGFSPLFRGAFLKPFLRGVLLDPQLSSDVELAKFYLGAFARGGAALPEKGIQALPELLADSLGRQHILLRSPVVATTPGAVVLQNGEELRVRKVVCAADALAAAALTGPEQTVPHTGTVTMYFLAERAPYHEALLMLNADDGGPINHLAVVTNVQPSYSPSGTSLISVSSIGEHARLPEATLVPLVRRQLHDWFGPCCGDWQFLRSFAIRNALPARPRLGLGWTEHLGVLYAGDYLAYGSQNGALSAGRSVAQHVLMHW